MKNAGKISKSTFTFTLLVMLLVALNIFSGAFHYRLDLTDEHRFTLSEGTEVLLKNLKDPVTINVLLNGDFPSGFRKLASSAEDNLKAFKDIAGNNIRYRFVSPDETIKGTNSSFADTLASWGYSPINLTAQKKDGQEQQFVYPFAVLTSNGLSAPVELYKGKTPLINVKEVNGAEAMLEYTFAKGIASLTKKTKPSLAYAIGNGEPQDYSVYDLAEETLSPGYSLSLVDIEKQPFIGPEFAALLIVKPKLAFTDFEKLKIDQYVMNGGKVLFFIDKLDAEMDSLQIKNEVIAYPRDLQIDDLLFRYGVRINPNLLMDLQCDFLPFDVNGNGQFELLPWNYFTVLESADNHAINRNLGYVSGRFVNTIDTITAEGIRKSILLRSSPNARVISSPALISGKENVTAPEDSRFNTPHLPVAVLLEGKFRSLYANRLTQQMKDSLEAHRMGFVDLCIQENKMVVVSDGDIVMNSVIKGNQPLPMGMNPYTFGSQRQFPFANREFLLNALDFLIDANGLSEAKNKDYTVTFLDPKKIHSQKQVWQIINIIIPVCLVFLFAMLFQFLRRRKYALR